MRLINNNALLCVIGSFIVSANAESSPNTSSLRGSSTTATTERRLADTIQCVDTLVADVQYADHHDETRIDCELEDGLSYTLDMSDEDVAKNKHAIATGKLELDDLPAGTTLLPNGKLKPSSGQKFAFKNKEKKANHPWKDRRLAETITQDKTVLVVRVEAADGTTGYTEAQLSNSVFGTNGDPVNLKSQYEACSHDKLIINPAPGITNGATTVTVSTSTSEGDSVMRNAVTAALNAKFGVSSPNQLADHVMYCLPAGTMGGIAYAYINSWNSVYSNEWCTFVSAQLHEIGHNLAFAHSNEAGTYKDQSGMMGYSYGNSDSPRMCFNGPKSWQAGWYADRHATWSYTSSTSTTYKLIGQANYPDAVSGDNVIVKLNTNTATDYYVSFNRKIENNSGTVEGGNQVLIWSAGGEGNNYAESELLAKLNNGGSYIISNFDGNSVTVSVTTIDTSATPGFATISIDSGTASPTPAPTPYTGPSSKLLACGSSAGGCAGQTQAADISVPNEVRCCHDATSNPGSPWERKYSGTCPINVWGQSEDASGNCQDAYTYVQALEMCNELGGRLCTAAELLADCTRGTGCNHDQDMIWSSTDAVTDSPSSSPVMTPTTESPTATPSSSPSQSPSNRPSGSPSVKPSVSPSKSPSKEPTKSPSDKPSVSPSKSPSMSPSEPEVVTPNPTDPPVTSSPSKSPTLKPTRPPSTSPTLSPSSKPSVSPSESPTNKPTPEPTNVPTDAPSPGPSTPPSQSPSKNPTNEPTPNPTTSPTVSTPPPTLPPSPSPTTSSPTAFNCGTFGGGGECKRDSRCTWRKGVCIAN